MHPVLSLLPLILVGSAEESVKKFKLSHKVSIHMLGRHGVDRMCVYRSMLAYLFVFVLVVVAANAFVQHNSVQLVCSRRFALQILCCCC